MIFEAPLFIPSGKTKKDIGTKIVYAMWGVVFAILIPSIVFNPSKEVQNVLNYFVYFSSLVIVVVTGSNLIRLCPLNGEIKGILKIDETQICYGDQKINLSDINDINFNITNIGGLGVGDYYGSRVTGDMAYTGPIMLSPSLSQGVQNTINIKTKTGEDILLNYRLNNREHIQQLKPLVKILAIKGKIALIQAISILKLNYKEVQELKKEMDEL